MKFSPLLLTPFLGRGQAGCEDLVARWTGVHADMHDGDEKSVSIRHHTLHILPHSNNQSWEVKAVLSSSDCTASVDFNVPGKKDHPPVPLRATFYHLNAFVGRQPGCVGKMAVAFDDPSGTLKGAGYPLNHWVVVDRARLEQIEERWICPWQLKRKFADMHDGDEKEVTIDGEKLTIRPGSKKEDWVVHAKIDRDLCQVIVDFNVPGKPSPPPVNLTATFWSASVLNSIKGPEKMVMEFTDPSATLADATYPLNQWVQLGDGSDPYVPPVAKGKCCYGFPGDNNWKGCQSATACPANPSCETPGLCEGICRGTWCNTGEELAV